MASTFGSSIKFATKNKTCPSLNTGFYNKLIEEVEANKFLGLQIDKHLNWRKHIEYIIPKLSSACFAMRTVVPLMTTDTLKLVYFAYFHSVLSYGLISGEIQQTVIKYFTSKRKYLE
jgi:hypothetical protein